MVFSEGELLVAKQRLFFDMDGTLIDSMGFWKKLKYKMCDRYFERTGVRIPLNKKDEKAIEKLSLKQAIEYINNTYNTTLDFENDACTILQNFYLNECTVKPYVRETLERLKNDGYKMCVITATPYKYSVEVLEHLDLIKYFDFVLTPTGYPRGKYTVKIFLAACRKFMCLPKNAVLIDDAIYAHITAKKLGIRRVGLYDSFRNENLSEVTDLNFNDFSEILDYYIKTERF